MTDEQHEKQDEDDESIKAEGFGVKIRIPKWVGPYVGPTLKWLVISLAASFFVYMVGTAIRMVIHD